MPKQDSIGMQAVKQIHELWQIDDDRCVWHENGIDWWPGDFKQSIRVSEPQERDGLTSYRLFAKTDYLKNISDEAKGIQLMLDFIARFAPSYSARSIPAEFFKDNKEEKNKVSLVSTAYVNDENISWLPRFFSGMAIMQPVNAQIQAAGLAESFGGRPDTSFPPGINESRPYDQMLEIISLLYAPEGQKPN
jgi:hypothetical protein